ncbi:LuxR C-terminal-related transcriptional regulator [Amycolatopsis sp. GM8]|uniref:LuxR C-terminal-related transcriptional regulator n=1 Tax=Amycolatopsis sp. GM8 TaxID=2896530 RepID=UPI001EFF9595|nr:LuxR C-terminal-related transcriptional regulator [Amycolatopsis sp. GM8]
MLEALGLGAAEEAVLGSLVDYRSRPGSIAAATGLPLAEVESILRTLLAKQLISRNGEEYAPAPPDVSLGPLLVREQAELEVARAAITTLAERYRDGARRRDPAQLVEVIIGADAIRGQALSLQRNAREEMLWFCRGGAIALESSENIEEFRALERGVRYRVLYENSWLEGPGAMESLIEGIRAGEIARTTPTLPIRLAVSDRSVALCPLPVDETTGEPTAALILGSSLLVALIALFDSYWERGAPVRIDGTTGVPLSAEERQLLSLLVSGIGDKSIAKALQVSLRTVQRRVQEMMLRANARSRMQLAWQASKLGWLDGAGGPAPSSASTQWHAVHAATGSGEQPTAVA